MEDSNQSTVPTPSGLFTPPLSADTGLDPATLGIIFDQNSSPAGNVGEVCCACQRMLIRTKNGVKKFDPVSLTDYCLERLAEIRRINELSHTPSAFSCLMEFIGFLSTLVYEGKKDFEAYPPFVHNYIKELYCARIVDKKKCTKPRNCNNPNLVANSWGEVLYSLVRCGLVHNMNVSGNRNLGQDQIKIALTHKPFHGDTCRVYRFGSYDTAKLVAKGNESVVLVINAFDLCDAVRKAVIRMFQKSKLRASARRVLAQRPIRSTNNWRGEGR